MKSKHVYSLVLGAALLLAGLLVSYLMPGLDSLVTTTMISIGLVLMIVPLVRHLAYGDLPETDERLNKISFTALSYSWMAALLFMVALIWIDHFNVLKLTLVQGLFSVYLVMVLSAIVFNLYLKAKGDVE